jgi:hypothetical protein
MTEQTNPCKKKYQVVSRKRHLYYYCIKGAKLTLAKKKVLKSVRSTTNMKCWAALIQLTFQGTVQVTLKVNSVLFIYLLFIIFKHLLFAWNI